MNTKFRFLMILSVLSILVVSCAPMATEAPATESPAPVTEAPAATESPSLQICSDTPDGLGQAYGSRPAAATYLGDAHGKFVYSDLLDQINKSSEFDSVVTLGDAFQGNVNLSSAEGNPPSITDLVVVLVVDTFSKPSESTVAKDLNSFIKRIDLYVNKNIPEQGLLAIAVDTNGLNFDDISNNIPAALDYFSANNVQLDEYSLSATNRFVVNMSFVFVPCNEVAFNVISPVLAILNTSNPELELGDITTMESLGGKYIVDSNFYNYVNCLEPYQDQCRQAVGKVRNRLEDLNAAYGELQEILASYQIFTTETLSSDQVDNAVFNSFIVDLVYDQGANSTWTSSLNEFYNTLQKYIDAKFDIVYVGAAGNFEYLYPLAPASSDFVDSVSSESSSEEQRPQTLASGGALAEYSNWGEIQMNGIFLGDPTAITSRILGTSFAAPKFSYAIAHYLLDGNHSPCASGPSIIPVLGYATNKNPLFTDSTGTSITNNNMTYVDAMSAFCP